MWDLIKIVSSANRHEQDFRSNSARSTQVARNYSCFPPLNDIELRINNRENSKSVVMLSLYNSTRKATDNNYEIQTIR